MPGWQIDLIAARAVLATVMPFLPAGARRAQAPASPA
jgi:hypothetical protein